MDTILSSYLEGFTTSDELQQSNRARHYLETYVISEIVKNYNAEGINPNIFYYRDKEKNEIDLIFEQIELGNYDKAYNRYKNSVLTLEEQFAKSFLQKLFVKTLKRTTT